MKLALIKSRGVLLPADDAAEEYIMTLPRESVLRGEFKRARNPAFHRKFFALLDIGYSAWEPEELGARKGDVPQKNREVFREGVIILAGFYTSSWSVGGGVKLSAKSIAFGNMDEDEFALVFSAVANVLLEKILGTYTRADLDEHVERILGFV